MRCFLLTSPVILLLAGGGCSQSENGSGSLPTMSVSAPAVVPASTSSLDAAKLLEAGDLPAALEAAERGVAATPTSVQALETRAAIQHKLGNGDAAINDFSAAIALDPTNARLLNNRGYLWLSREEFDKALADFDAAIAAAPEHANAHNNRGLLQIARGRYRQAILDFDRALQISPEYVDAWNNRGFAEMQLGRWDRALADFNRALAIDEKNVNAIANRGFVKQNLGDTAGAIFDFTSAMMLDPDNPKYYVYRREAHLLAGDFTQAQSDAAKVESLQKLHGLSAAIARDPGNAGNLLARGRYHQAQGALSRALEDFSKAVKVSQGSVETLLERAQLHVAMSNLQAAIDDCDTILKSEPHQLAFSIRGDCRLKLDDLDGALADFESAKRLDSRVAEAYLLKGQALARSGDTAAADEYRARAIALEPSLEDRR